MVEILKRGGQFEDVKDLVAGARGERFTRPATWTRHLVGRHVMGLINDIPTVGELVSRIVDEAEEIITGRLANMVEPDGGRERRVRSEIEGTRDQREVPDWANCPE